MDSLETAVAPREAKLERMSDKMKEMDEDLQRQLSTLNKQKHLNKDLKSRMKAMSKEVVLLRQALRDKNLYIQGFAFDLNRVMELPHGRKEVRGRRGSSWGVLRDL